MLKNADLLAKIGADTAENEQHVAEILPIGRRVAEVDCTLAGIPKFTLCYHHRAHMMPPRCIQTIPTSRVCASQPI